jgi:hypothetical protein
MKLPIRQESAPEFMLRKPRDFVEWLTIGDSCTMVRIRECIRRYPKFAARYALRKTCMLNEKAEVPK